jgi:hypothetical protein
MSLAAERATSGASPGVLGSLERHLASPEFMAWQAAPRMPRSPRVVEEEEDDTAE